MSVINTNVKSIVAQSAMTGNNRAMSKAMEQLSTGKRINGAADDAAGLAISSKMTSQIRGLNQAVRNANDGISMMQTAEGALVEVTNMLQRMRELAVQSASDTNVQTDRDALQQEFAALGSEVARIANNTQWNGMNILNATGGSSSNGAFTFQVGANQNQTVDITIASAATPAAATQAVAVASTGAAGAAQAATFTFTTPTLGDVVTMQIGDNKYTYTTTAADMAGADAAADLLNITNNIKNMLNSQSSFTSAVAGVKPAFTATNAAGVLTITAGAAAAQVTVNATMSGSGITAAAAGVSTRAAATTSIGNVDTALASVNTSRSNIGATINRLNYASLNLENVSNNTSASRSRVLDTDYAATTTELARTQIISQAATAMLAQANQAPQTVLALLR
jgi:flagellin